MTSIISRYLDGIATKVAQQRCLTVIGVAKSPYIPTNINQLCLPAISWYWKPNPIGQISYEQFQFSDTAPLSVASDVLFTSSGNSVSENYRTFLYVLKKNENFPYKTLLNELLKKNEAPESYADGWIQVLINGSLEWKPDWIFSDSVYSWKQKVQEGTIDNSGTIKVALRKGDNLSNIFMLDNDTHKSFEFISQFETVEVYADAWGIISIRPGSWFNNSILKLGKDYIPKNLDILTSRVAAFYVAANPKFTFKSNIKIDLSILKKATSFQCFGIDAQLDEPYKTVANSHEITLYSKTVNPAIVGVVLERL
ncbi:hypothetical protein [Kordia sp.]|uniref:hypothetical protein n=1 Tax=Kordia sp. TaxID=1965332 RepID=UPI003D29C5DC